MIRIPGSCLPRRTKTAGVSKERIFEAGKAKAQEYSERLPGMASEAGHEKAPFEAVYPYADAPKCCFPPTGSPPKKASIRKKLRDMEAEAKLRNDARRQDPLRKSQQRDYER